LNSTTQNIQNIHKIQHIYSLNMKYALVEQNVFEIRCHVYNAFSFDAEITTLQLFTR